MAIDGPRPFNSVQLIDGAVSTHTADTASQTHELDLTVTEQVIVDATSSIDVSGKGYLPGYTTGNTTLGGATGNSGGSYGGLGGSISGATNAVYGDYAAPDDWGAGGLSLPGGGLVRLTADTLTLDGSITANGGGGPFGAGAGGGVYVAVQTLSGGGSIDASGGSGDGSYHSFGGGGGRIAVYAQDYTGFNLDHIQANGGNGYLNGSSGGAGTVYVKDTNDANGTLIIDGRKSPSGFTPLGLPGQQTVAFPDAVLIRGSGAQVGPEHAGMTLEFDNTLTVQDSATLNGPDTIHITSTGSLFIGSMGNLYAPGVVTSDTDVTVDGGTFEGSQLIAPGLSVTDGGLLTSLTLTATQMYELDVQISGVLSVDATSSIDVSGKGYLPGYTTGNTTLGGATGNSGGSYGGLGGSISGATNAVYGDYAAPDDWGAGGLSLPGGGLVRLTADTLTLDGSITVNGGGGPFGAGAGGGVYVAVQTLSGGGSIDASGGSGDGSYHSFGGGGGRIAVYAQDYTGFNLDHIQANGGNGYLNGSSGGAGTVYVLEGVPHTHVRAHFPYGVEQGIVDQGNGYVNQPIDAITLTFNNPIDVSSFDPSKFLISGQMGVIQPTGMTQVGDRTYRIDLPFALSENGPYYFTLLPTLLDAEGFEIDQNANGIPGETDDAYSFTLIVDTVPPHVSYQDPAGDLAGTISSVDVWFSEAIDTTTFTTGDASIVRPDGTTMLATGIQNVGLNEFQITFPAQTLLGTYHVKIDPSVTDLAGNGLDEDGDGIGGEPTDVYDRTFNLVNVDLGLNSLNLSTTTLTAGEAVTVSWSGANLTGAPLLGDWIDAVYLSTDGQWDINATLLATVPHTGGLAQNQRYSASATVVIPGVLPGNYQILVRADVANQERESNEANNLIASGPLSLVVNPLGTDGGAVSGTLTNFDPADYYAVNVGGGESLGLNLTGHATTGANELYVSLGSIPTQTSYDFSAVKDERFVDRQDETLAFTAPPGGGTYYVLVYGDEISGSTPYDLTATTGPFVVTSLTPPLQGNSQSGTITLQGAGFDLGTTVQFVGADQVVQVPTATYLISASALTLDLDLPNWTPQTYTVLVTKGATTIQAAQSFEVVAGGSPDLQTKLVLPSSLVGRGKQTLWLEYTNTGTAPMAAPVLRVTGGQSAQITLDPDLAELAFQTAGQQNWPPTGFTNMVEVLGTGSGATPGILQPGDSGRIPIYYVGLKNGVSGYSNESVGFTVSTVTQEELSGTTTARVPIYDASGNITGYEIITTVSDYSIPWTGASSSNNQLSLEDQMRPESIPADAWDAIWQNLSNQVGSDYGNYSMKLAADANYLYTVGQTVSDVSSLWGFEIAQADAALNPLQSLAGAVDASVPTPGLALTFSRVYGESITSRYQLGPLGRGWTDNWDVSAETEPSGDVVLQGPGGVDRFFTLQADGSYTPSAGDFASLTLSGGGFRLTETDQTIWQFRTDGKLAYVQDSNGNRITLGYDTSGLLTSLTDSDGQQLLIDYNADGRIAHVTNPLGPGTADDLVTTYLYDASGEHLIEVIQPGNRVTTYSYDTGSALPTKHALLEVDYPDGTHDYFAYDSEGRLISTSGDQAAQLVTYTYDTAGGVTITDATGRTTYLGYGVDGQIAQVRDGDGNVLNLDYNTQSLLDQLVGPIGEKYGYSYDSDGNLTGVRNPLGQTTSFTSDPTFNQLTSVTDPNGNGMQYAYDAKGNLISITYADGTQQKYTYDASGDVLSATNRRSQVLNYTYNAAGQVTSEDDPTTPGIDYVYAYDTAGNLVSATDASGTTTMTYDPNTNFLTCIDYPGGQFFTFAYNAVGQRAQRTDQDGNVEDYYYNSLGQLDHMTDGTGALIVAYEYDDAGRLSRETLGNGVYTTYEYDAAGDILDLVNYEPDGSVLSRYDYTYDASGLCTSMTTLDGTQTYGYDPLGQLTSVTYPDGQVVNYAYDAAGNRTQVDDNGVVTPYLTNNLNEYTTVGGATYTYDADGNMTSETQNGVTTTYSYDVENRLIGMTTPTDTWTYAYDAFGNRVASTDNGVTTNYVIDPTGAGNVAAEYDGSGNLIARYDDGYGLVSRTDASGNPDYYTFSAIGNTSELTNASGAVDNSYSYDPFGISLGKTEAVTNPFQYVGEYGVMNEGNGLEFMRARFYNTEIGRFVQQDPIGVFGGVNQYSYVSNEPVSSVDVSGLLRLRYDQIIGWLTPDAPGTPGL